MSRPNVLLNSRMLPGLICLVFALLVLAAPAAAATTRVNVTKYCDNNYSAVENSTALNVTVLQTLSSVYSNGTYIRNLTDRVGGMSVGDEIKVA